MHHAPTAPRSMALRISATWSSGQGREQGAVGFWNRWVSGWLFFSVDGLFNQITQRCFFGRCFCHCHWSMLTGLSYLSCRTVRLRAVLSDYVVAAWTNTVWQYKANVWQAVFWLNQLKWPFWFFGFGCLGTTWWPFSVLFWLFRRPQVELSNLIYRVSKEQNQQSLGCWLLMVLIPFDKQ